MTLDREKIDLSRAGLGLEDRPMVGLGEQVTFVDHRSAGAMPLPVPTSLGSFPGTSSPPVPGAKLGVR